MIIVYSLIFLLSLTITRWFQRFAIQKNLLDHPNHRSAHTVVTPRGGGIVFVILWALLLVLCTCLHILSVSRLLALLPASLLIAIMGYWDDHGHIPVKWRLLVQAIAAISALWLMGGFPAISFGAVTLSLGWVGSIVGLLVLIWSTNLFNFMDGADGMASTEAILVLATGGFMLWQVGGHDLAILAWGLAFAVLGFLPYNWPPAKIFMGDVGSTFLGFVIAAFAIAGQVWYQLPFALWFILYSAFWFDASVTLIRRVWAGEKWYEAHRLHAFQRFYQIKDNALPLVLFLIATNVTLTVFTLFSFYHPHLLPPILALTIFFLLTIYLWIELLLPMYPRAKNKLSDV